MFELRKEFSLPLKLKSRGQAEIPRFSVEPLGEHVSEMSCDIHNTSPLTVNLSLSCPDSASHFWQRAITGIDGSPTSIRQTKWMTRLPRFPCGKPSKTARAKTEKTGTSSYPTSTFKSRLKRKSPGCAQLQLQGIWNLTHVKKHSCLLCSATDWITAITLWWRCFLPG